jgi:aspartate aminotransferase-like enzyme
MSVNFRLPGPTPLPPRVVDALGQEMIPHRGPAFRDLFTETLDLARKAHRTNGDVLVWAGTGSAGWEVAIVNLLSPGDPVLAVANGNFGERFARGGERLGLDVRRLEIPWGEPVLPEQLRAALNDNPEVRAVFLVHNETSTGVTNPLRELAAVVREHGALLVVDAVSSAGALPLEMDAWGIDLVLSGSQKAWMCPPGLLIVAAGPRVWEAQTSAGYPRFFWDMADARTMAREGTTTTTAPLSLIFALHAALQMIDEEGIEQVWERHRRIAAMTRQGIRDAGLDLLAAKGYESDTVTAFFPPDGVSSKTMLAMLRDGYRVEAQAGQAHLAEAVVRVGHMGWVHEPEMREALAAIAVVSDRLRRGEMASTAVGTTLANTTS